MLLLVICRVFSCTEETGISLNGFLRAVGTLKFRGTSGLFRLPNSPVTRGAMVSESVGISQGIEGVAATATAIVIPQAVQVCILYTTMFSHETCLMAALNMQILFISLLQSQRIEVQRGFDQRPTLM